MAGCYHYMKYCIFRRIMEAILGQSLDIKQLHICPTSRSELDKTVRWCAVFAKIIDTWWVTKKLATTACKVHVSMCAEKRMKKMLTSYLSHRWRHEAIFLLSALSRNGDKPLVVTLPLLSCTLSRSSVFHSDYIKSLILIHCIQHADMENYTWVTCIFPQHLINNLEARCWITT